MPDNARPLYQLLWAKTSRDRTRTHALAYHLIDVAEVVSALWEQAFPRATRQHFAQMLGMPDVCARCWLAFIAGLHDLGKASPAFQSLHEPSKAILVGRGLSFDWLPGNGVASHADISAKVLPELLSTSLGMSPALARPLALAVGAHHGAFPNPVELQRLGPRRVGGADWQAVRQRLIEALLEVVSVRESPPLPESLADDGPFWMLLSGLVSFADWLGSIEDYFFDLDAATLESYAEVARRQATRALKELGWLQWVPPSDARAFQELFSYEPRPMQRSAVALAEQLAEPALVIIEAPTGEGKTEAALYLADHWVRTLQQRGAYVAMPTQATSNQMFERVQAFLQRRFASGQVGLFLLHGEAMWSKQMQELRLAAIDENMDSTVVAHAWFLPKKRSLLGPFAVGTVDQALLGILHTRHFFVRLFGLSQKTLIFDEVHAYDTYMSTLFQRLLAWLRAAGTSVVILSATLPSDTRRQLLKAYASPAAELTSDVPYPAITWAKGGQVGVVPLQPGASRDLSLEWIDRPPSSVARLLAQELRDGGCAAVLCNTVRRSQELYGALKQAAICPPEDLILFHGRFPPIWRNEIEDRVIGRYGKNSHGRRHGIVVATQVIEQSLDLDFDLMVTDLAPVDLLIQRAGRLHRHQRDGRPETVSNPRLLIATPDERQGVPDFGADAWVYEPYILLRSYLALQGCQQLELPRQTQQLIEAVYAEQSLGAQAPGPDMLRALAAARRAMQARERKDTAQAYARIIGAPEQEPCSQAGPALDEDNPELHSAFRALTRLSPLAVSLVCLHQTDRGMTLDRDGSGATVSLDATPDYELTRELRQRTVSVARPAVVQHFLAQNVPVGWQEHPLLKYCRPAVFRDDCCRLLGTAYSLRLSRELGLEIEKEV